MTSVEPIRKIKDIKKLEKYFKTNPRNFLLFKLGINCGLRISDILMLDVKDVKDKKYITVIEKKTNKKRIIPLNKILLNLINKYTKDCSPQSPLFRSKNGNRLDRINAYKILKQACNILKIDGCIGTHTLRKTFGYHFYDKYKDVALLQKILNHSSPQITLRYIGIEDEIIFKKCLEFEL